MLNALGVLARFLYDRWWPLLPLTVVAALVLYRAYEERLAAWREVGRIRAEIARDLHDDIGASLSQIALLSEVVRCRVPGDHPSTSAVIQIGSLSREVLDCIGDTVWSLNPHNDSFGGTIERLRDFAGDLFAAREIAFRFHVSNTRDNFKLTAFARRQLLLIFKEAVNNIVRHAECTEVDVEVAVGREWLELSFRITGRASIGTGSGLD